MKKGKCHCGKEFDWSRNGYSLYKEHVMEEIEKNNNEHYFDPPWVSELRNDIETKAFEMYTEYFGNETIIK